MMVQMIKSGEASGSWIVCWNGHRPCRIGSDYADFDITRASRAADAGTHGQYCAGNCDRSDAANRQYE